MHGADTKITSCTLARDLRLFQLTRSYLVQLFLGIWRSDSGEKRTINSITTESPYTLFLLQRHYAWPSWNNHIQAVLDAFSEFKQLGCKVVLLASGTRDDGLVWRKQHPSQFLAFYNPKWIVYWKLGLRRILKILTIEAMCGYGERIYCPAWKQCCLLKLKPLSLPNLCLSFNY